MCILYNDKFLIYDKVLRLGVTDPLSPELYQMQMFILAYLTLHGGFANVIPWGFAALCPPVAEVPPNPATTDNRRSSHAKIPIIPCARQAISALAAYEFLRTILPTCRHKQTMVCVV